MTSPRPGTRLSWGRTHRFAHDVVRARSPDDVVRILREAYPRPSLAYGLGRSYGDSCLNGGGVLIDMRGLDRFVEFDDARGRLVVEAGVSLAEISDLLVSRQAADGSCWFLPVSPGTAFVTVGGAIANDVHGKNHHRMGSFGNHVRALWLLRSDGRVHRCSFDDDAELYRATIGGLGLTGVVLRAELQLRRVRGLAIDAEDIRFDDLGAFYDLADESADEFEYTVAWIDCLAQGRGIFSRGNHAPGPVAATTTKPARWRLPIEFPVSPLNRWTVGAFNALYWRRLWPRQRRRRRVPVAPFLHPLDGIAEWNRLYGRAGFYQYQCVLPPRTARDGIRELLTTVAKAGDGSFLAVLKTLGDRASVGLLSFPMPGTTLALDFPNRGAATLAMLDRLDAITAAAGGRIYPAKDGRMAARHFTSAYPGLERFRRQLDPGLSSSFWRRMGTDGVAAAAAA